jgi:hypothetical protein
MPMRRNLLLLGRMILAPLNFMFVAVIVILLTLGGGTIIFVVGSVLVGLYDLIFIRTLVRVSQIITRVTSLRL